MEKVVIVIGSTGGLSSEMARKFGAVGARVVLTDIPAAQKGMEKRLK